MGGQGSGRPPSTETIIKRMSPEITPVGTSIFIPNYSGVQEAALKTSKPLSTATATGGGHTIQDEGVSQTQRTNLNFSGSGVVLSDSAGDDATFVHIITSAGGGDHAVLSNLDYASAGHTGFTSETIFENLSGAFYILSGSNANEHTIYNNLSGSFWLLSGAYTQHEAHYNDLSGAFWALSGSNATEHTTLSGVSVTHTANIASLSGSVITLSGVSVVHTANIARLSGSMLNLSGSVLVSGANVLTTGLISGSKFVGTTISGSNIFVTEDYTTFSGAYVANIVFGTGSTPPTASNFPQGTIYVQYTA